MKYAVNSQYIAFAGLEGIQVQSLTHENESYRLPYDTGRPRFDPVLAFSPTRLNLLAAANGAQILILNVRKRKARCVLRGNGRTVTSLAFSAREHEIVVAGAVDGSISVWSIKNPSRPLHQLKGLDGACANVTLRSYRSGILASSHKGRIATWSLLDPQPLIVSRYLALDFALMGWRGGNDTSLLVIATDGLIYILSSHVSPDPPAPKGQYTESSVESSHDLDSVSTVLIPLGISVRQAHLLGSNGIVVLPCDSNTLYFYSYTTEKQASDEVWQLHTSTDMQAFSLHDLDGRVDAVLYENHNTQVYNIPALVLDAMGCSTTKHWPSAGPKDNFQVFNLAGRMLPEKLHRQRRTRRTSSGASLTQSLITNVIDEIRDNKVVSAHAIRVIERPETPTPKSMKFSLELSKPHHLENEDDSPMPFLSPAIPARKVSPGSIAPIDEIIALPPPRASFDSGRTHVTRDHDSDSDDETFAGGLQDSRSFLPGGVNVPLPRTCGALFAANGQLLTFFPYQPQAETNSIDVNNPEMQTRQRKTSEVSKLFPAFGNFASPFFEDKQDERGSLTVEHHDKPLVALRYHPLTGRSSWPVKTSPVKASLAPFPGHHKVRVSVHELGHITPTHQSLAVHYRVSAGVDESATDICRENSDAAAAGGMTEAAEAWKILGMILESKTVTGYGLEPDNSGFPTAFIAQRPLLSTNPSLASTLGEPSVQANTSILHSPQHPLGGVWAVKQLFSQLEQQANVQLLACMSAVVAGTSKAVGQQQRRKSLQRTDSSRSEPTLFRSADFDTAVIDATKLPPGLPVLRTNSLALTISDDSPIKMQSSYNSSRTTSQPTTPYLESLNSTVPLTLPATSKYGTALSNSGSASPELHRSSFSLAAKNYAASIAEKFASYGSSPPTKRLANSPGNELSSSLPTATAAGSWSKSVSFASTIDAGRSSHRSLSLAQEDDDYDSDRTIDDSLPRTPRTQTAAVVFRWKNDSFFNEAAGNTTSASLSTSFQAKSTLWQQTYAEQLRSWGYLLEAAELQNVSTMRNEDEAEAHSRPLAVVFATAAEAQPSTCSICFCLIRGAKQVCPTCLHTSHPECLDHFISTFGDSSFTCPAGCECDCASTTDIGFGFGSGPLEKNASSPTKFREAGLTDPLRLHQRLQVESWG